MGGSKLYDQRGSWQDRSQLCAAITGINLKAALRVSILLSDAIERRCRKLASALHKRGFGKGDSISILAPNIPEMLECHFAIPMIGAANNTRLDAATIAYILDHCEAKIFFVDTALSGIAKEALGLCESARLSLILMIHNSSLGANWHADL